MQAGETVDYEGPAVRVLDDSAVEIAGTFTVGELRKRGGDELRLLTDARLEEFGRDAEPDAHRYLISASWTPPEPEPEPAAA